MITGRIVFNKGDTYQLYSNGVIYNLYAKGLFRSNLKNSLVVGDTIDFDEETYRITSIGQRTTMFDYLQVSNIEQILIILTEIDKSDFIDLAKILLAANINNIPCTFLLFKDADLSSEIAKKLMNSGANIGVLSEKVLQSNIFSLIIIDNPSKLNLFFEKLPNLQENYIDSLAKNMPLFEQFIAYYGEYQLMFSSVERFKNLHLLKGNIASYFPPFQKYLHQCKNANCLHIAEIDCRIKKEVELHNISLETYELYCDLLKKLA